MKVAGIGHRIYADFAMPSRLSAYQRMLSAMLEAGYSVCSVEAFWRRTKQGTSPIAGPHVILRHDVDTDPQTAARMWAIDQSLGIAGSYYFRLSTLDPVLMREIAAGGGEASYHYEELATIAKRRRLHRRADAEAAIPTAQEAFRRNIERLREVTGLPMGVVASHGDFVNRALGLPNWVVLADPSFRASVGVELEVYDDVFAAFVSSRHSDTLHPRYWVSDDPLTAIERADPIVYVLVHPRHWYARRSVNALDDLRRVAESLAYRLPSPGRG